MDLKKKKTKNAHNRVARRRKNKRAARSGGDVCAIQEGLKKVIDGCGEIAVNC